MAAKRKYNWEEWFDRPRTMLVNGVDYHCSQSTMAQIVRNNASRYGVRIKLKDIGEAIIIEVMGEVSHPDKTAVAG